jgi:hypothetical protein
MRARSELRQDDDIYCSASRISYVVPTSMRDCFGLAAQRQVVIPTLRNCSTLYRSGCGGDSCAPYSTRRCFNPTLTLPLAR